MGESIDVGTPVTWVTGDRQQHGKVVAVVSAGIDPYVIMPAVKPGKTYGATREVESYLVKIEGKPGLYWPESPEIAIE